MIYNPGSILVNTATNKLYGALVTHLPNDKIIVFRLDKNTHPVFSKFELHDAIMKVGVINEHQYSNLKSALLRHYRTYNLTPTEKKMLQPLMNFAFPLGIPEYNPGLELPERDLLAMDLNSKLTYGARFYINTPAKSSYNYLDGKIISILERNPEGIWVKLPTNETDMNKLNNSIAFIYYRNPDIPTFSGISRITPVTNSPAADGQTDSQAEANINEISGNDVLLETFHKMKEANELITTMEFNGDKVRVVPKTMKIIFPEIYSGMIYNPQNDTFFAPPDVITPQLSQKLGTSLILGSRDKTGVSMEMNGADNELVYNNGELMNMVGMGGMAGGISASNSETVKGGNVEIGVDGELIYQSGGVPSGEIEAELDEMDKESSYSRMIDGDSYKNQETGNIDDLMDVDADATHSSRDSRSKSLRHMVDTEQEYLDLIQSSRGTARIGNIHMDTSMATGMAIGVDDGDSISEGKRDGAETESEYDEDEFIEVIDDNDIEKQDTFEKIKILEIDELERIYPLQKGDLISYKIEQIPPLLRTKQLEDKIIKQVNLICLLKEHITDKETNEIKFKPHNYKPLLDKYVNGDFTTKYLIPLVINKKKIYLGGGKGSGEGGAKEGRQNKDDFDTQTNEIIDDFYTDIEQLNSLQNKKNVSINHDTYTSQIISAMNPTIVNEADQLGLLFRLGSQLSNDDYTKLQQDTLTIRYCDKPMKCQSYSLNAMNFDYQVNLGAIGRFISDEDANANPEMATYLEDEDNPSAERDIMKIDTRYKIYYPGDLIRIIGYVRPPVNYFSSKCGLTSNSGNDIGNDTLIGAYSKAKNAGNVVTVNLEDINPEIIDEDQELYDINIHPENFVIFLLPQDSTLQWSNLASEIDKIIPSIDDILKVYFDSSSGSESRKGDKIKQNLTIENIYNVLERFEYDTNELPQDIQQRVFTLNEQLLEFYTEFNNKLKTQYTNFIRNKKTDKDNKDDSNKDDSKFKYITNSILDDISKFYFEKYDNHGATADSDDTRLRWFMNSFDNGRYFIKTLFMNYLKSYQEGFKLENLETELSLLKSQHAVNQQTRTTLQGSSNMGMNGMGGMGGSQCTAKIATPNIIKYPNLARLEQDNGKVAVDSDGNVIMVGDYALVEVDGSKQLYKRDIIGNIDMWIKEDLAVLYKLILEKKNQCIANPEIKLEKANECTFDMEAIKCEHNVELDSMKETIDIERNIADLQKQIDYIKHLPVLISTLDKEIHNDRTVLLTRLNNLKRYWREKEEAEQKLDDAIKKTISRKKPCPHFDVTDYFFKINGYNEDRYQFARSIIRNFLNTDPQFDKPFNIFHDTSNGGDIGDNFSHCNICNQQLLCNHFRLGISYLEDDKPINFERIITVFAQETNGGYFCRACGEFIDNTEVQDLDDFAKGEDGHRVKTREVMEDTPIIEKQKKYIDGLIDKIIEGEPSTQNEDLQTKISIYKLLKKVSGLDILSITDEVEMMNFLKSYTFITRDSILKLLIATIGKANPVLLSKKMEQLYMIYLWCDIAARYLIILQTTKTPYNLRNKECSGIMTTLGGSAGEINIMGYPLIDDTSETNGINFILCIISQISLLPDYASLSQLDKPKFLKQLQKQVDEDNFVKSKLYVARNGKGEEIDMVYEFMRNPTNYWKTYLPRMSSGRGELGWSPEKILNDANLKEVSSKNWHRMIEVGTENAVFYSLSVIKSINTVIDASDRNPAKSIYSYCCPYKHSLDSQFEYIKYFTERDGTIMDNMKNLIKTEDLKMKLFDIRRMGTNNFQYEPLYKPSQTVFGFNLDTDPDEIRNIYRKFIDVGLNKGKLHVYDKYGRCILSNEKERDIIEKTYTQKDYKVIEDAITNYNSIDIKKYIAATEIKTNLAHLEMEYIENIILAIPKLDIMKFLRDFFIKIKENYNRIFSLGLLDAKQQIKGQVDGKDGKGEPFNIHRHLSQLNAQIQTEINALVTKLASTDKLIDKYNRIISNLGNFRELYEEYVSEHTMDEGIRFRYTKMEETLHSYLKYLNDIIIQIKNRKLSTPLNKESIRPEFREFLQYAENTKLFKLIDGFNSEIYHFSKLLKSKNAYKVLFPEMVASLLHYVMVLSLVNLFDSIDNSKLRNGKTDILEYNFINKLDNIKNKDAALVDYSNDMGVDLVTGAATGDIFLDEDGTPIDLLDNIKMKNSNNIKTITNFIISFIERVDNNQSVYDSLTYKEVNLIVTRDKQKDIENTLKTFEWLAKENNEENRLLLQMKMRMGRVGYGDVRNYIMEQIGRDVINDDDDEYKGNVMIDDGGGDGDRGDNDFGMDKYELDNELPMVVDYEDMEDGDMDYDYLAVGEDD